MLKITSKHSRSKGLVGEFVESKGNIIIVRVNNGEHSSLRRWAKKNCCIQERINMGIIVRNNMSGHEGKVKDFDGNRLQVRTETGQYPNWNIDNCSFFKIPEALRGDKPEKPEKKIPEALRGDKPEKPEKTIENELEKISGRLADIGKTLQKLLVLNESMVNLWRE